MLVAIGGEVGHVAEQHGDILVAPRDHRPEFADLVSRLFRQQRMQQLIGLCARLLRLAERFLERQLRLDPSKHDRSRERLVDVIDGADLETLLLVDRVSFRREEDDGDFSRLGIRLEPAANLVAVHARHHHVEQDQVRCLGPHGDRQRLLAIGRHLGVKQILEHPRHHGDVGRRIVNHEHELAVRAQHHGPSILSDRREAIADRHLSAASNSKLPTWSVSALTSARVSTPASCGLTSIIKSVASPSSLSRSCLRRASGAATAPGSPVLTSLIASVSAGSAVWMDLITGSRVSESVLSVSSASFPVRTAASVSPAAAARAAPPSVAAAPFNEWAARSAVAASPFESASRMSSTVPPCRSANLRNRAA